ncbi:hypothetical protein WJX82_004362 [Trebouxia sp. C0006]
MCYFPRASYFQEIHLWKSGKALEACRARQKLTPTLVLFMETEGAGEARLEVALAQAIINEVKYGSETSQLAEVSLLAAFQNRLVGKRLVHALLLLMPGLKYFSIGALLKDGVIVRTSNLAVEGPVEIEPRTLRGSAARVAARKQTTFHTKKRLDEDMGVKYYELQEAWDVAQATSVLTVPIPAVRTYESASIADTTPPLEETASDPASHVCPVLHSLNGAVGVVTLGLATEDIDLDGRQGKAFQGIAQSLSPFLAYYAAPVLKQLQQQIRSVANANAASVARFKAKHAADTSHGNAHASHKRRSTDGSEASHVAENTVSPFLAAAYSSDLKRRSDSLAADSEAQPVSRAGQPQRRQSAQALRQTPNPFAQGVMFGRAPAFSPASAVVRSTSFQNVLPTPVGPSRLSQQLQATEPALDKEGGFLMEDTALEAGTGLQQADHHSDHVDSSPSKMHEAVKTAKHAQRFIQQHPFWMTFTEPLVEEDFNVWFGQKCSKVDTIFMLVATIYITQLLFFTWALADQQAQKWPLFGYIMVPVLILQHGDTAWFLKNRISILGCIRVLMLAFLALVVPYIVQSHPGASTRWMDMSGLGPLVVIPLGLLVRFKVHVVLHAVSCASLVVQGLQTCMAEPQAAKYPCQTASMQRLVVATCAPSAVLYLVEMRARAVYLQTAKS